MAEPPLKKRRIHTEPDPFPWHDLSVEVRVEVHLKLDPYSLRALRLVSTQDLAETRWALERVSKHVDVDSPVSLRLPVGVPRELLDALRWGHEDLVLRSDPSLLQGLLLQDAASFGSTKVYDELYMREKPIKGKNPSVLIPRFAYEEISVEDDVRQSIQTAIRYQQIECLHYLLGTLFKDEKWDHDLWQEWTQTAVACRYSDCLQCLDRYRPKTDQQCIIWNDYILSVATSYGRISCIEYWLSSRQCTDDSLKKTISTMVILRSLVGIKILHRHLNYWDIEFTKSALLCECFDILDYVYEKGFEWPGDVWEYLRSCTLDNVKRVQGYGIPLTSMVIRRAATCPATLPVIRYALECGVPWPDDIVSYAINLKLEPVLTYVIQNGAPYNNDETLMKVVSEGSLSQVLLAYMAGIRPTQRFVINYKARAMSTKVSYRTRQFIEATDEFKRFSSSSPVEELL